MEEIQTKHLDMQLAVNLRALILGTREGLPLLREAGAEHGKALIVNTASIAGKGGQAWLSIYAATKAAVINFTQSTHREAGGAGIQCTALAPGFVDTAMTEFVKGQVPAEEMIQPSDLGEAVRFLLRTSPQLPRAGDRLHPPRRGPRLRPLSGVLGRQGAAMAPRPAQRLVTARPGRRLRRPRTRLPGDLAGTGAGRARARGRGRDLGGAAGARSRAPGSASPRPRNTGCSRRPSPTPPTASTPPRRRGRCCRCWRRCARTSPSATSSPWRRPWPPSAPGCRWRP